MTRSQTLLAIVILTACPRCVFAHAVGVSCTIRGAQVEVEAYYDDDSPAIKAMVQVLNAKNEVIATGDTDEKGRCVLTKPGPGTYTVKLDAGAGHRAKATFTVPGVTQEPAWPEAPTAEAPPGRVEFTQTPWLRVMTGLVVIAAGCLLASMLLRKAMQAS